MATITFVNDTGRGFYLVVGGVSYYIQAAESSLVTVNTGDIIYLDIDSGVADNTSVVSFVANGVTYNLSETEADATAIEVEDNEEFIVTACTYGDQTGTTVTRHYGKFIVNTSGYNILGRLEEH